MAFAATVEQHLAETARLEHKSKLLFLREQLPTYGVRDAVVDESTGTATSGKLVFRVTSFSLGNHCLGVSIDGVMFHDFRLHVTHERRASAMASALVELAEFKKRWWITRAWHWCWYGNVLNPAPADSS